VSNSAPKYGASKSNKVLAYGARLLKSRICGISIAAHEAPASYASGNGLSLKKNLSLAAARLRSLPRSAVEVTKLSQRLRILHAPAL